MGGGTGIVVETRYRVTVDGTVLELDEAGAHTLMDALAQRLLPSAVPLETRVHVLAPQPAEPIAVPIHRALPGPTPRPPSPPDPRRATGRGETWTDADTQELERLVAEGLSGPKIAQRMEKPTGTISYQCARRGLKIARVRPAPREAPPPRPHVEPTVAHEPTDALKPGPDDWTPEETKALIATMAAGRGLRDAMTATGHTFLSCSRRWTHLKEAGLMTIERYMASQESTMEDR